MKIDIKTLSGEDLFYFMTSSEYEDAEYSSVVKLLPYATMDMDNAIEILERVVQSDRLLVAIYPSLGDKPTDDMEFVGIIPDGVLYIK